MQPGTLDDLHVAIRSLIAILLHELAEYENQDVEKDLIQAADRIAATIEYAKRKSIEEDD